MEKIEFKENMFDSIKHVDEEGREYWLARELMPLLDYNKWENFHKVIKLAMIACKMSGKEIGDCFPEVRKPIITGKGKKEFIVDYKLSRYACYLIAQSGDNRKKAISVAKTYFAIKTRKMELLEQNYNTLTEDEKRIYQRDLTRKANYSLNQIASKVGVKHFDKFHNAGYMGLYNGETANDIAKRKGLRYREDILDNMGSVELAANLFRITQTDDAIKNNNIVGEDKANKTHYNIGRNVRHTIKKNGGTMPEDLPTPNKSIKELEKDGLLIK